MDPATLIAAAAQQLATTGRVLADIAAQLETAPPATPTPAPITLNDLLALLSSGKVSAQVSRITSPPPVQPRQGPLNAQFGPAPQISESTPQFSPIPHQVSQTAPQVSPAPADIEPGETLPTGASMTRDILVAWLETTADWLQLQQAEKPEAERARTLNFCQRLLAMARQPGADVAGLERSARQFGLIDDVFGAPPPKPGALQVSAEDAAAEGFRIMHIEQRRAMAANPSATQLDNSLGAGGWGDGNNVLQHVVGAAVGRPTGNSG